jgi:hypothetical protein
VLSRFRHGWAPWAALAAVIVAIGGPFLVFLLRDLAFAADTEAAAKVFRDWQDLLGGVLALVGAAAAALVVVRQIDDARAIADERRGRRADALWSTLTHDLYRANLYLTEWQNVIEPALKRAASCTAYDPNEVSGCFRDVPVKAPDVPAGLIDNIRILIEHCDERDIPNLSQYSSWLQIHHSRLQDMIERD